MRETKRKYILYVHIAPNGKRYYGITSMKPSKRWGRGSGYKKHPHFYNAIQKYGWDNFKHIVVLENLTCEEACKKEIEYIAKYNTTDSSYGYNSSIGGDVNTMSKIARNKLSNDRKGVRHPERMTSLDDDWCNDVKRCYEENAIFNGCSNNARLGVVVECSGVLFNSIAEFSRAYSLKPDRVSRWLCGKYPVPKCYVDMGLHIVGDEYEYEEIYNKSNRMIELDGILFDSVSSCADAVGVDRHTIARWLNGKLLIPPNIKTKGLKYVDRPNYYYKKNKGE